MVVIYADPGADSIGMQEPFWSTQDALEIVKWRRLAADVQMIDDGKI